MSDWLFPCAICSRPWDHLRGTCDHDWWCSEPRRLLQAAERLAQAQDEARLLALEAERARPEPSFRAIGGAA